MDRILDDLLDPSTIDTTGLGNNRFVGFWAYDSSPVNAVANPKEIEREVDGAFRPSESQWAGLKFSTVRDVAFRDERATDGKIAINEDTTTPVFSPYSGRVNRLIARPGDLVERGQPLFAIAASEFDVAADRARATVSA